MGVGALKNELMGVGAVKGTAMRSGGKTLIESGMNVQGKWEK